MISYKAIEAIKTFHKSGHSVKAISESLNISQPTVRAYIKDPNRGERSVSKESRKPLLDQADKETLINLYAASGYNSTMLAILINEDPLRFSLPSGFNVSDRTVRRYMSNLVPKHTPSKEFQYFESLIGQQLQIDFTYAKYTFEGDIKPRKVCIFEAVYTWSHKTFFMVCPDSTQASWLRGITNCLLKYGVPKQILCDNEKSLVLSNNSKGSVKFNQEFLWFCKQFDINPRACMPGSPQTKGAVERAGKYLKDNGLKWIKIKYPEIKTLDELNNAIQVWNDTYADIYRKFEVEIEGKRLKKTVKELFEMEAKYLGHVNPDLQLSIKTAMVAVDKEGYISIHGVRISVPIAFRSLKVCVLVCSNGCYIISNALGVVISEGRIPEANLIKYRFEEYGSEAETMWG